MGKIAIYSKETNTFLREIEVKDEIIEWLMTQKDPSKAFETMIEDFIKSEVKNKAS